MTARHTDRNDRRFFPSHLSADPAGGIFFCRVPVRWGGAVSVHSSVDFIPDFAMPMSSRFLLFCPVLLLLAGCGPSGSDPSAPPEPITEGAYLTADTWNDGRAEVAFYQVERTRNQYGEPDAQSFTAGTYLVKHQFSPEEMTKVTDGGGVSAFKYAFFYEFESGSYEYKRNWVVNARQSDLRPLKQSFTSFDWCSNQYRELAFPPEGPIEVRMRSDDYGNRRDAFPGRAQSYPVAQVPLLMRGLDLTQADTVSFAVATAEGQHVPATATLDGRDSVETPAGRFATERIRVRYDAPVPSMVGEESDSTETYWRGAGPQRLLVKMEAASGRYRVTLVEHLRSAYWQENLWPRLERIEARP